MKNGKRAKEEGEREESMVRKLSWERSRGRDRRDTEGKRRGRRGEREEERMEAVKE